MNRLTRIATAVAAPVLMTAGLAAPAAAVTDARLAGDWETTLTVLSVTGNSINEVGEELPATFNFNPTCAYPEACNTKATRTRPSGSPARVTTLLRPLAAETDVYRGVTRYVSACFDEDGNVVERNGLATTETTRIRVTDTNSAGVATEFTGRLTLELTPTAAGRAAGCRAGTVVARIDSDARV